MTEYPGQARDTGLGSRPELGDRLTPMARPRPAILLGTSVFYGVNQALYDISMDIGERMVTASSVPRAVASRPCCDA